MKVIILNDGKEKFQSFEAKINIDDCIIAYGDSKEEAIRILKYKTSELIESLKKIDYEIFDEVKE